MLYRELGRDKFAPREVFSGGRGRRAKMHLNYLDSGYFNLAHFQSPIRLVCFFCTSSQRHVCFLSYSWFSIDCIRELASLLHGGFFRKCLMRFSFECSFFRWDIYVCILGAGNDYFLRLYKFCVALLVSRLFLPATFVTLPVWWIIFEGLLREIKSYWQANLFFLSIR